MINPVDVNDWTELNVYDFILPVIYNEETPEQFMAKVLLKSPTLALCQSCAHNLSIITSKHQGYPILSAEGQHSCRAMLHSELKTKINRLNILDKGVMVARCIGYHWHLIDTYRVCCLIPSLGYCLCGFSVHGLFMSILLSFLVSS